MKTTFPILLIARIYIIISGLALLSVSIMAMISPQAVMDLVQVELTNTDAYSSIRGVYGGVGLTIFFTILYLIKKHLSHALALLALLWGFYALSRIMTIFIEGELGSFGNQWLYIESILFILAIGLYIAISKVPISKKNITPISVLR
jgi:hypothetical protein